MRSRLVTVASVVVAVAVVAFVIIRLAPSPARPGPVRAPLPTGLASYLGVYEAGPPRHYRPVAQFTKAIGEQPNLVGYYSGWRENFALSFAATVHAHNGVAVVQWDPTNVSIGKIADGGYDRYLRSFADSVEGYGQRVVIGFGHEMNASWYSWGYGQVPSATFVAAWRHVVTIFRQQGAVNVTWLWTINADLPTTGPIGAWWPGARYVTWVGIDGYYYTPGDNFANVFGKTLLKVRALTDKPVLLSETAVGPWAGQPAKIANLFAGIRQYGMLGLIWFDIRQNNGLYHQDWRLENNPAAEAAFRQGASTLSLARL